MQLCQHPHGDLSHDQGVVLKGSTVLIIALVSHNKATRKFLEIISQNQKSMTKLLLSVTK